MCWARWSRIASLRKRFTMATSSIAIMDAAYESIRTKKWEPISLEIWRGREDVANIAVSREFDEHHFLVKKEQLPDGKTKVILRNKSTGQISQRFE